MPSYEKPTCMNQLHETLHDRFRAFKPYDRALATLLVVLVAVSGEATLKQRMLIGGGGLVLFWLLEVAQRWVRVPTPPLQAGLVAVWNTLLVSFLVYHLGPDHPMAVPLYILNVAFATVAFGQRVGLIVAALSAMALGVMDVLAQPAGQGGAGVVRAWTEWALIATILTILVALLSRVTDLQYQALTDGLTGLRNYRYFRSRLREELARSARFRRATALALLDLDDFKRVNDRFGHAAGDGVLRRVAEELARRCRATDVLCRYGGEELAVILPETGREDAHRLAERLRLATQEQFREKYALTVSIGVAVAAEPPFDAEALIRAADVALYQAKTGGKNQVCTNPAAADGRSGS
jgi:diguanylate cyclase (GGDEF)-like protein